MKQGAVKLGDILLLEASDWLLPQFFEGHVELGHIPGLCAQEELQEGWR